LQKLQENQKKLDQKLQGEFSNGFLEVKAQLETQQKALIALQSEIEQIQAVQQQQSAILAQINAQLLHRQ